MSIIREHIVKRFTRSNGWSKTRKKHLKENSKCEACNSKNKREVHHVKDFSTNPELELDQGNLITLCRTCHLVFGHLKSWKSINEDVVQDSVNFLSKVINRR